MDAGTVGVGADIDVGDVVGGSNAGVGGVGTDVGIDDVVGGVSARVGSLILVLVSVLESVLFVIGSVLELVSL